MPGATVTATNVATNIGNGHEDEPGRHLHVHGAATRRVHGRSGADRLQAQRPDRRSSCRLRRRRGSTSRSKSGAVTEEVSVVSQAPLVRSTSSEQGQVIDYKQIQSLPLNGRLFQQLITLTPGRDPPRGFADFAENPAGAGARSAVHHSVNGLPWSGNNYLLDGVANNEPLNAFVNITPPLEALQEFKVQTNNPTAEFGVFGGAVVNLSIRSGTNQFSGSVFEYYRDESLNARNFFAATKAPFNSHQFGGTFGGPLLRNKAFFFGDYQRLRQDQGRTVIATVPTAEMRRGDLSASQHADLRPARTASRSPATSSRRAASTPSRGRSPTSGRCRTGRAWSTTTSRTTWSTQEQDAFDIRGDLNLARWGSVFGRYSRADRDFVEPPTGNIFMAGGNRSESGQLQPRARAHVHVVAEPAQRVPGRHQQVRPRPVRLGLRHPEEQRARHPQRQHRRSPVHVRHRRLQRRGLPAHRLSRLHQLGAHRHDGAALGQLHVDARQALGEVRRRRPASSSRR